MPRTFANEQKPDIFVYGLTGAGKDTIANYLGSYHNYRKIRIAGTIKQIICERHNLTADELEQQKRLRSELRMEHHTESEHLGNQQGSLNRTHQIAVHNSFDLQLCDDKERQLCVTDNRTYDEAKILLDNDWLMIALARTTAEFKKADHFTEVNMFLNDELIELAKIHAHQMLIVFNGENFTDEEIETYLSKFTEKPLYLLLGEVSAERLTDAIDSALIEWQPEYFEPAAEDEIDESSDFPL